MCLSRFRICLLVPVVCLLSGAAPEEKISLEKTATPEQLVTGIKRHTETLAEYLKDEKAWEDNLKRDKITAKGGAIAVLAQALLHHQAVPGALHVPAIRSAGQKVAMAESQAEASAGLQEIQKSLDYKGKLGEVSKVEWTDVIDMTNLMEETNYLYQGLKRTVRRSSDPEGDAMDAITVALLAFPLEANLDYAFDEADEAKWKMLSKQMHDDFQAVGEAIRAKDTDKSRELYETLTRSCVACHKDFRE